MNFEQIVYVLKDWSNQLKKDIPVLEVYLFGSSIINDGFLFDVKNSDIDLVIMMPDSITNAVERTEWLAKLIEHKGNLELSFVKLFKRNQNNKPIVSVIAITRKELFLDIHKSGVRDFFRDNEFYNVMTDEKVLGLIRDKEVLNAEDIVRQLFEFSQGVRNKYLAIGFVQNKAPLYWQSDEDVAPKELIRTCALAAFVENEKKNREEKTDIKIGLSHLQYYIYSRRHENELYLKLNNWLGKRALRKGDLPALESVDYVFISEMIFDMALSLSPISVPIEHKSNVIEDKLPKVDIDKSIETKFVIGTNGLINGIEEDIHKEIINAGINLAWKTEPYFDIIFEEIDLLEAEIVIKPKEGKLLDKLRKLKLIRTSLIEGFKYIIYYQNYFFKGSDNVVSDILTSLRMFTLTRFSNVLLDNRFKGTETGFLEAYIIEYKNIPDRFPNVTIKPVLNFGLPDKVLNKYLRTNKSLNKIYSNPTIMSLAAHNQPIRTLSTDLLATFFVPLLIQRLFESNIEPMSIDKEIEAFNNEFTDLDFWYFGIK